MNTLLAHSAFSVGTDTYTWGDVVVAAIVRGDWAALEDQTRQGLALARQAEEHEQVPSDQVLETAAQDFRYERELITAEEMEAWLARFGLTVDDWMDYLERAVLRSTDAGEGDEPLMRYAPEDKEVTGSLPAEVVCSGALERFADALAARAAVGERASAETGNGREQTSADLESTVRFCSEALARLGFSEPPRRDRIAAIARLEHAFEEFCGRLAGPAAIRSQIEVHRLDWIRLDLRALAFPDEEAAREASLCLREDRESLEKVAQDAHVPIQEMRVYLADVDASARPDLLSARPGDLVGPLWMGDRFYLLQLCGKALPSEEDLEVRRRAEEALRSKVVEQEVAARVRWHDRI